MRLDGESIGAGRRLRLQVVSLDRGTEGVVMLELRDPGGRPVPAFTPGAHLEVYLPNGLVRHYSLCNDSTESDRYVLGVGLAASSRGGSSYLHRELAAGDTLETSVPRNNFPLVADAPEYCFIAGGIGITPILSMIRWCVRNSRAWRLYDCARSRRRAPLYEELRALASAEDRIRFHFDDEHEGHLFDPRPVLDSLAATTHVYCCGPGPLMDAVSAARGSRLEELYHFEWFTPVRPEAAGDRSFCVVIHSSGQRIDVPGGRSILSVLEEHGLGVPSSCREGLCGTCETPVLSGVPDHRDRVLTEEQKRANRSMMICVSRAKSDVIELDL